LAHLDEAQTPTLVVHGDRDERVHPEQGLELYTGLRLKDVPTSLVMYPRELHGLRERAHLLDFMERSLAWFERYLSDGENSPPTG
jgi:dipeptidyl aminopeptidase/acylaminoacyl peptidase